ncbi:MAG: 6-bladed beta-propeller [Desulfobacterales bacterium]|nr:6-bladed beta-propeller [Desulfobacterales bacterium]
MSLDYRRASGSLILAVALVLLAACATWVHAGTRTRIAIVDLESQGEKAKAQDMGKIAAQWLTTAFVQQGRFDVAERQALKKIMKEQELGLTGVIDDDTAARLGRVLGAAYIVTGAMISYEKGVELNVKIIETESAAIRVADRLTAANVSAMSQKVPAFVGQLASQFSIEGYIVHQKGETFTIDAGSFAGAKRGMQFDVYIEGESIKHPVSGEILGVEKIRTGQIKVTEVQKKLSFARIVKEEPDQAVSIGQRVVSLRAAASPAWKSAASAGPTGAGLRFSHTWGRQGTKTGDFYMPYGVTADAAGNVYVADTYNSRIQVFDTNGGFQRSWGQKGTGSGSFVLPYDVAVDSQGNVYVADTYNIRIQKFDSNGTFLLQWGKKGKGSGDFAFLGGIAVGPDGSVYTVDAKLNRVQVFDGQGRYLRSWGRKGKGSGDFAAPMGIAVDGEGNVYVADSKMRRVQKFDSQGRFVAAFSGKLKYPADVAVDPTSGNLLVLDAGTSQVLEMSADGKSLRSFGEPGNGGGQFIKPYGITADGSGNVFVADTVNSRVEKFAR